MANTLSSSLKLCLLRGDRIFLHQDYISFLFVSLITCADEKNIFDEEFKIVLENFQTEIRSVDKKALLVVKIYMHKVQVVSFRPILINELESGLMVYIP